MTVISKTFVLHFSLFHDLKSWPFYIRITNPEEPVFHYATFLTNLKPIKTKLF